MKYNCEVCGREIDYYRVLHADGKCICYKHYNQFKQFGEFKDNIARTIYDKNEIVIYGDIAHVILYDTNMQPLTYAIIDAIDIYKVKDIKWHINANGYAVNTSRNHKPSYMHRVILGIDQPVDHINTNKLDNRRCNLRPITQSQNQMNCNYRGYTLRQDNRYQAYIKLNQMAANLGIYNSEEEAKYARWHAEKMTFREYAYDKPEPKIPEYRKCEIRNYVDYCLERLFTKLGTYPLVRCNNIEIIG